ncbi:SPFH domain-containing protein [Actinospica durhamensis]|uniref:SPFH domain-containing protein n=1 Tax=Actinospica durhamensis TaxID=1508375 RepID=A0A941IVC0_9ACTN|nr:SPFH domain-containing protein [Actinospica durhamensis]MBR7839023.1 SPFH domain-containing protein [Actinospica durhamensis]
MPGILYFPIALVCLVIPPLGIFLFRGLVVVRPNQAVVLTRLGKYAGTLRKPGWFAVNPISQKQSVSLKIRTNDSEYQKVNDMDGNPVEVSAMVVWQVQDTARAVFDVLNYDGFVELQTQAALHHIASRFPYDSHGQERLSLSGDPSAVADALRAELGSRLVAAGIDVLDVRLRRIAYAPEVAGNMLRRQQASAVVGARFKIVEGALGMIDTALEHLQTRGGVTLDESRKAQLVSNLLVVLCSEQQVQPVLNTGAVTE